MQPGEYIRNARSEAHLSLRALAAALGVSHVFLSKMERGLVPVPEQHINKLAEQLPSVEPDRLLVLVRSAHAGRTLASALDQIEMSSAPRPYAQLAVQLQRKLSEQPSMSAEQLSRILRALNDE